MKKLTPKKLKAIRVKLGLTQAELAEKLFCNDQHISRMENGKVPVMPRTASLLWQLHGDNENIE